MLAATWSVVAKTAALYAIMVTGAIWEKVVFGRYLFAPAFYWEDVFSMVVIALHTAYVAALLSAVGTAELALRPSRSPPMPPTRSTRRSSCPEAARRARLDAPCRDGAA